MCLLIHSFIHSRIYKAPLQEIYSEALVVFTRAVVGNADKANQLKYCSLSSWLHGQLPVSLGTPEFEPQYIISYIALYYSVLLKNDFFTTCALEPITSLYL